MKWLRLHNRDKIASGKAEKRVCYRKFSLLPVFGMLLFLLLCTTVLIFYAQGYRIDLTLGTVEKTGMILARSVPEGAKVYLNGELATATDSPIPSLEPGTYHLKMEKEGHFSWEKDVPVEEGLVTDISALLPPLSPSLTAVTQKGARLITLAPSGSKALFISGSAKGGELYLLSLNTPTLGFLRTSPQKIAEESEEFPLSEATKIAWSPNEDQALLTLPTVSQAESVPEGGIERSYLISATGKNGQPTLVEDVTDLLGNWSTTGIEQKAELIKGTEISEELATEATKVTTIWSPDELKFLYEKEVEGRRQFWVANLSDPLPVGDEEHQQIWETESATLELFWLADSRHFVMIDNGVVSLLDLDGSNKRDLFQGTLAESVALSTADLSKIIIVTSLAPETPANLYAISLK